MINLTVKTLDSRNHQFSVEDDTTVEKFKQHIAETVNIPADTQRIIYCGRVLQNSSKLIEHDLDGKVVHLVQRPPPGSPSGPSNSRSSRSSSPHPSQQRRPFRNFDHGNTMVLGSMTFPSGFMEAPGASQSLPTYSTVGGRQNIVRRMLRRAERLIDVLENPERFANGEQPLVDDQQEEATPIIEARVIVPGTPDDAFNGAAILSALRNSLNSVQPTVMPPRSRTATTPGQSEVRSEEQNTTSNAHNATATPNATTDNSSSFPENASRTMILSDLLTQLSQVQTRFAPFLQRFQDFMRDDPVVPPEESRNVQMELNRVSEILHLLGHAYHGLSDVLIRVRTPPPRALLSRPVLIQHSAVLQAGIPIQVEAQFNLSGPGSGESRANDNSANRPQTTVRSSPPPTPAPPTTEASAASRSEGGDATQQPGSNTASDGRPAPGYTVGNPEVEFIMEVTPDGITIDSLEAGLIGPNQADELLRGALNGQQPPNFIQSIMQMAGQLLNQRRNEGATQQQQTSASTLTTTPPTQNSQARGNNQTNPTSSTNTRSTPRPHVHLQHQTMQGVFDPLLPCNSHHLIRRRMNAHQQQQQQQRQSAADPTTATTTATTTSFTRRPRFAEQMAQGSPVMRNSFSLMGAMLSGSPQLTLRPQTTTQSPEDAPDGGHRPTSERSTPQSPSNLPPGLQMFSTINNLLTGGATISQLIDNLSPDHAYVRGENIGSDVLMLISRNLTFGDIISIHSGDYSPLQRLAPEIQRFFVDDLLHGSRTSESINKLIDLFFSQSNALFNTISQFPIREDVDIDASLRSFLRARLPNLIDLVSRIADQPDNLTALVDQLRTLSYEFCALVFYSCVDGVQSFDRIFEIVVTQFLREIPLEMQPWALHTNRTQLQSFVSNLNVPNETVEPYIVRRQGTLDEAPHPVLSPMAQEVQETDMETVEPMETEAITVIQDNPTSELEILESPEPLTSVVLGSEAWHGQVPADWVPIIARDAQKQKKQNSQPPFSDAYLSGMPSKRRKLVHGAKGRQDLPLPQIISESVRMAVTSTGLSAAAPIETVAQAAGQSTDIQSAYRDMLKSSVQSCLKENEDFTPEKFPHATNYFKSP